MPTRTQYSPAYTPFNRDTSGRTRMAALRGSACRSTAEFRRLIRSHERSTCAANQTFNRALRPRRLPIWDNLDNVNFLAIVRRTNRKYAPINASRSIPVPSSRTSVWSNAVKGGPTSRALTGLRQPVSVEDVLSECTPRAEEGARPSRVLGQCRQQHEES